MARGVALDDEAVEEEEDEEDVDDAEDVVDEDDDLRSVTAAVTRGDDELGS